MFSTKSIKLEFNIFISLFFHTFRVNGVFYLETNNRKIFAKGKKGVVKTVAQRFKSALEKLKKFFRKHWW